MEKNLVFPVFAVHIHNCICPCVLPYYNPLAFPFVVVGTRNHQQYFPQYDLSAYYTITKKENSIKRPLLTNM